MKALTSLLFVFLPTCVILADDSNPLTKQSHYVEGFYGQGQIILGSEDARFGGGIGYAYCKPEPRYQWGPIGAQMVYEIYIDHTQTPGANGGGPNSTFAYGTLAYGRWRWPLDKNGNGVYFDFGWGFQLADQATVDLDSQFNSTPVAGFGGAFKMGDQELLIGLRLLHISNGGLKGHNFGQNELLVTAGVRF